MPSRGKCGKITKNRVRLRDAEGSEGKNGRRIGWGRRLKYRDIGIVGVGKK